MFDIRSLYEPRSVAEACALRLEHPEAHIIAGGSDVLIELREGRMQNAELLSLFNLDELRGITQTETGTLRIGSLTSFTELYRNPLIRQHIPTLGEAGNWVGGPQIRNIGTIGGNTCNGVTSADTATTLLAYDAKVELQSTKGTRILPLSEFYLGIHKVDIRDGEIQTALLIEPDDYLNTYGHYFKYAMRDAMDIATCSCSVNLRLDQTGKFERVRISYGVAAPVPIRSPKAEACARGLEPSEDALRLIARTGLEDIQPRSSWRATAEFRKHMTQEILYRCLKHALSQAQARKEVLQ